MSHQWKPIGWWERFIDGINCISINVWMFAVIIVGSILVIKGNEAIGSSLVTGAFAIFSNRRTVDRRSMDDKVDHVLEKTIDKI